jgi:hypothetical protein
MIQIQQIYLLKPQVAQTVCCRFSSMLYYYKKNINTQAVAMKMTTAKFIRTTYKIKYNIIK